jgi:hypothetical protein
MGSRGITPLILNLCTGQRLVVCRPVCMLYGVPQATVALPWERASATFWIEGWVAPSVALEVLEKWESL